jgi:hypothetical protein
LSPVDVIWNRVAEFLLRPHFTFSQRGRAHRPRRPPHRATAMRLPHFFAACAALLLGCAALCGGAVWDGALGPDVRAGTATPAPIRAQPAGVADAVIGAWWTRNTPGLHHSREESARGLRRFLVSAATSLPLARTLLLTDEDVSLPSPRWHGTTRHDTAPALTLIPPLSVSRADPGLGDRLAPTPAPANDVLVPSSPHPSPCERLAAPAALCRSRTAPCGALLAV